MTQNTEAMTSVERVAMALRAELERQQVPMSEPSDSDPIKHMIVIYRSPAVSLEHLARAALEALPEPTEAMIEAGVRELNTSDLVYRDSLKARDAAQVTRIYMAMRKEGLSG